MKESRKESRKVGRKGGVKREKGGKERRKKRKKETFRQNNLVRGFKIFFNIRIKSKYLFNKKCLSGLECAQNLF